MKQLELKDFLQYQFLSELAYAPDGKKAAFVVSKCSEEENTYESRLWLWDGTLRQLTDLGKERRFLWEDENHLLFPAVRSAQEKKRAEAKDQFTSYYRLDLRGGEAVHAFTLPFAVHRMERAPGGWAALGLIDAACQDFYQMNAEERAAYGKTQAEEQDYEVLDEIPFWHNGGSFSSKKRTALFWVPDGGPAVRVTEPLEQVGDIALWNGQIYYLSQTYQSKLPLRGTSLRRMDPETGKSEPVLTEPELALGGLTVVGDRLWIGGTDGARHGLNENSWIYVLSRDESSLELLRREEYSMYSSVGSDCRFGGGRSRQAKNGSLYHLTTREDSSHLYRLDSDGSSTPVVTKPGSMDCIALSEQADKALAVAMYDGKLQELYEADLHTGAVTQLSHFNDAVLADKYVAAYQPLTIESCGETISGYVLLPENFAADQTYPAVLDIHGGPKTVYGPVFYHEMQLWANLGYVVFFCNPKGGDGRDNRFMDIRGHYGETDYQNLMDFTDAVLKQYPQIDRSRLCVTGGSYGGFMTNWIIGHTDRFCCAASQRSISNWLSFYGVSDIGWYFAADQCDGDIYSDPQKLWEHSPLKYAAQVRTPTLFIHSDEDYRCPLEQGLQMFTALCDRGVEARMCLFHGENHELSRSGKPKHRIRRLTEITNWFEAH